MDLLSTRLYSESKSSYEILGWPWLYCSIFSPLETGKVGYYSCWGEKRKKKASILREAPMCKLPSIM